MECMYVCMYVYICMYMYVCMYLRRHISLEENILKMAEQSADKAVRRMSHRVGVMSDGNVQNPSRFRSVCFASKLPRIYSRTITLHVRNFVFGSGKIISYKRKPY
jgi:hypothetical protein